MPCLQPGSTRPGERGRSSVEDRSWRGHLPAASDHPILPWTSTRTPLRQRRLRRPLPRAAPSSGYLRFPATVVEGVRVLRAPAPAGTARRTRRHCRLQIPVGVTGAMKGAGTGSCPTRPQSECSRGQRGRAAPPGPTADGTSVPWSAAPELGGDSAAARWPTALHIPAIASQSASTDSSPTGLNSSARSVSRPHSRSRIGSAGPRSAASPF